MWYWRGDWNSGDWISMGVMMLLVWLPLLLVVALALRAWLTPGGSRAVSAEDEARRAYAQGAIDRERFLQVMQDLREHRTG